MAILLLVCQKGSVSQKIKFVCIVAVIVLIALGLLFLLFPALMEFYISRFQMEDLTTGRMDLMAHYHEFVMSDPVHLFFGIGLHDFNKKVMNVYRIARNVPHNGVQELIVAWGLPGLIMFLILWVVMILRARQCCKKQGLINYIPLLIILLKVQAGQMLNSAYTMLAFSFAYLSMCCDLTAPEQVETEQTT
jgi:O-antigen ligase